MTMTGFLGELSPTLAERVVDAGVRRRYPARSFLFHEGDDPLNVFLVESGLLRAERTLRSGRTILLTLVGPGDLMGELAVVDGTARSATASTIGDSRVLVIPGRRFENLLAADAELTHVVLQRVTRRMRRLTDQLVEATALSATARVATRLIDLIGATGAQAAPDGVIDLRLPITQEELAQWAGLSREGAVKGISELRNAGVLTTARKRITIVDPDRLRSEADRVQG